MSNPYVMARNNFNHGSFTQHGKSKGSRGVVTKEVNTGATITRGMFVALNAQSKAVAATDAAALTFVGIAVAKPVHRKGKYYVRVFTKGFFKMAATSITGDTLGAQMYVKDSTTFDETVTNHVKCGRLVKIVSNTLGWIELNVDGS